MCNAGQCIKNKKKDKKNKEKWEKKEEEEEYFVHRNDNHVTIESMTTYCYNLLSQGLCSLE